MKPAILNLDELSLESRPAALAPTGTAAERYDARIGMISARLGAEKLGYNLTVVPPGKSAFPFHNHIVNEEMVLVLEGQGEIRIGENRHPLRAGDVVALPAGGPETAHKITNTGTAALRYLAVSTRCLPEIAEYPDSGKFGVLAERPDQAQGTPQRFMFVGREKDGLDYWAGE